MGGQGVKGYLYKGIGYPEGTGEGKGHQLERRSTVKKKVHAALQINRTVLHLRKR